MGAYPPSRAFVWPLAIRWCIGRVSRERASSHLPIFCPLGQLLSTWTCYSNDMKMLIFIAPALQAEAVSPRAFWATHCIRDEARAGRLPAGMMGVG